MVHKICFLLFDRFQLMDVCGPLQAFATANDVLQETGKKKHYQTLLQAISAGSVLSSSGVELTATKLASRLSSRVDTVVVPGGPGAWNPNGSELPMSTEPLVQWLNRNAPRIDRLSSVCTGAFVLARTGLLDGRSAVTHWLACDALRAAAPNIDVQQDAIYFIDGPYWTSAGITSGIDMALGMIEADLGRTLAMTVAKRLVVFYKRPGGQSQFSSALLEQTAGDSRIEGLHKWLTAHLREDLDVDSMAERLSMTPRTFARFYVKATGVTPARALEQMRLERACRLIESQHQSVKATAQQSGFSSEEIMRRTFVRHLKVSPMEYRERFSAARI